MRRFTAFSMGLIALAVVGSASAGGGSTVVSGYGGKAGGPVGAVVTSHPANTAHGGATLPFTGFNLVGITLLALLLVALGVALTRFSRKHESS
jgi:hypothetical protein